jgi:hypothetical protein
VLPPTVPAFGAVDTPEQHRRGLGVRDLANAIEGGTQLASAPFAFHVLEALCAIDEASSRAATVRLASTCARPLPRNPD